MAERTPKSPTDAQRKRAQTKARAESDRLIADANQVRWRAGRDADALVTKAWRVREAAGLEVTGAVEPPVSASTEPDSGYVSWGLTRTAGRWRVRMERAGERSWSIRVFYRFTVGEQEIRSGTHALRSQKSAESYASSMLQECMRERPRDLTNGWVAHSDRYHQKSYDCGLVASLRRNGESHGWELSVSADYARTRDTVSFQREFGHTPAQYATAAEYADRFVKAMASLISPRNR